LIELAGWDRLALWGFNDDQIIDQRTLTILAEAGQLGMPARIGGLA
jgi:hypothetical protein